MAVAMEAQRVRMIHTKRGGIWGRFRRSRPETTKEVMREHVGAVGIRVTHMPTGITVMRDSARSRNKNKVLAQIALDEAVHRLVLHRAAR